MKIEKKNMLTILLMQKQTGNIFDILNEYDETEEQEQQQQQQKQR